MGAGQADGLGGRTVYYTLHWGVAMGGFLGGGIFLVE